MRLFKLKPEIAADSMILLKIMQEIFGRPYEFSFSQEKSSFSWKVGQFNMTLSHGRGDSIFDLNVLRFAIGAFGDSSLPQMWDRFMELAEKPWSDWSEDEIMESTMWCRYFVESGNIPSGRIHTMMVLKSYENMDDPHIKGYFRCVDQQHS